MGRVPLAWRNLTHDPRRLALSVAGVGFAVLLILMQLGFRNAMIDSQVEVLRRLDCDLALVSPSKYRLYTTDSFPQRRLLQALGHESVVSVSALHCESEDLFWRNPVEGNAHFMRVLAFDPDESVFLDEEIRSQQEKLKVADTVLMDRLSKELMGPVETGVETVLSGRQVRVVGTFALGTDLGVDGNLIMSDRTFLSIMAESGDGRRRNDRVELGLLHLVEGADEVATQASLRDALPDDVSVLTKDELIGVEAGYWLENSAIGVVFNLGTVIGFIVGLVICYQVLFTDISDNLPQLATLRAIGHANGRVFRLVLTQAALLSLIAFVPAVVLGRLLYGVTATISGLAMRLTPQVLLLVFAMTVVMCSIAGALAARKAMAADPAEVF
ncbi:MAG: ABC transporter permease DevC [Acidobacteriota bacterium]